MAKRLGKEARRRERRTEKEPPSSAVSSGLLGTSEEELILSGEEESLRSSGLRVVELGDWAGVDLARAEGADDTPLLGLWE